MDYVIGTVLNNLTDYIVQDVYSAGNPSVYERTGDFLRSWQDSVETTGNEVVGTVYQDYNSMSLDPENFTHGSLYYSETDMREGLAYLIFSGLSGEFFGNGYWTQPRNAWKDFVEMFDSNKMDSIIIQGLRLYGFEVRKGGYWKKWAYK